METPPSAKPQLPKKRAGFISRQTIASVCASVLLIAIVVVLAKNAMRRAECLLALTAYDVRLEEYAAARVCNTSDDAAVEALHRAYLSTKEAYHALCEEHSRSFAEPRLHYCPHCQKTFLAYVEMLQFYKDSLHNLSRGTRSPADAELYKELYTAHAALCGADWANVPLPREPTVFDDGLYGDDGVTVILTRIIRYGMLSYRLKHQ